MRLFDRYQSMRNLLLDIRNSPGIAPTLAEKIAVELQASAPLSLGTPLAANEIPQGAVVWSNDGTFASGVYIGNGIVLTAQHVATNNVVGVSLATATADNASVKIPLLCPVILPDNAQFDIAVLRIKPSAVPEPARKPIPLATEAQFAALMAAQAQVQVVGFGCALSQGDHCTAGSKSQIDLNLCPPAEAADIDDFIPGLEFVAGDPSKTGPFHETCKGDSGGPAFATINGIPTLVGIVHGGGTPEATTSSGCGLFRLSVFTRVDVAPYRTFLQTAQCA
jgi:secreted trypsin-like serine protease